MSTRSSIIEEVANLKLHVKKNDTVVVISGKDAGKTGEVLKVYPKSVQVFQAVLQNFDLKSKKNCRILS